MEPYLAQDTIPSAASLSPINHAWMEHPAMRLKVSGMFHGDGYIPISLYVKIVPTADILDPVAV